MSRPSWIPKTIEVWYLACALVAFTTSGITPILMPLEVVKISGQATHVGLVLAAMGFGMLSSPIWGTLVERRRWHRGVIVVGALSVAVSIGAFYLAREVWQWVGLGLLMGCGIAAKFTAANLLVLAAYPANEVTARIGWSQMLTTVGTVGGLAAAGAVTHLPTRDGFLLGAAACVAAALLGAFATPNVPEPIKDPEAHDKREPVKGFSAVIRTPFGAFLGTWLVANLGMHGLNGLYPLVMREEFQVSPKLASFVLAGATALSTLLYVLASRMSQARGGRPVLKRGLGLRLLALTGMCGLLAVAFSGREIAALLLFTVVQLSWPLLSVSGSLLSAQLAPGERGGAVGLYNSSNALAALIGPVLSGGLADHFGYGAVIVFALVGVVGGLLCTGSFSAPNQPD